jgi:hypothetical protein
MKMLKIDSRDTALAIASDARARLGSKAKMWIISKISTGNLSIVANGC